MPPTLQHLVLCPMQEAAHTSPTIDDLPAACLVEILQYLPVAMRLESCALVCSSWSAATAAATRSICVKVADLEQCSDVLKLLMTETLWTHQQPADG